MKRCVGLGMESSIGLSDRLERASIWEGPPGENRSGGKAEGAWFEDLDGEGGSEAEVRHASYLLTESGNPRLLADGLYVFRRNGRAFSYCYAFRPL